MSYGRRLAKDAGERWSKWPADPLQLPETAGPPVVRHAHPVERRARALELLLVAVALCAFVLGYAAGQADAASRSAHEPLAVIGATDGPDRGQIETSSAGPASPEVLVGIASWHATGRDGLYAAAGPALRVGEWRGATALVCGPDGDCISVVLNDWCQCHVGAIDERLIDLSDEAFGQLAPLSVGLVEVTVTVVGRG